ncbi:MAG: hypothetical protein JWN98_1959 [Abditibacteriota bacterium]|nr:hypothetical protein [Abditibacteriota bacterium]
MLSFRWPRSFARLGQILLLGIVCALFITAVKALHGLDSLERISLDSLFRVRGKRYPAPEVVLVVVDEETAQRQWPIPRNVYAEVVERLSRAGARTIAFDITFPVKSSAADDEAFIAACRKSGRVVQAVVFSQQLSSSTRQNLPDRYNSFTSPIAGLKSSAVALGHVNMPTDADGARRVQHLISHEGHSYPSLALAAASHFYGLSWQESTRFKMDETGRAIRFEPAVQNVAPRVIPVDRAGKTRVNWCGPAGVFPSVSFTSVLDDKTFASLLKSETFKDRIVLIGVTVAAAFEWRATPFSNVQPAVEFQANALSDILLDRHLHEVPDWLVFACTFALAMIAGALVAGCGALRGAFGTLVLTAALYFVAIVGLKSDIYLPIAAPLLSVVLSCVVAIGYLQISDARQLKQTVVDLRLAEERYILAVRGANDGLWDWDIVQDKMYFSPRWKEILGLGNDELGNSSQAWFQRIHPDDLEQVRAELATHLGDLSVHFQNEHRIQHKDGTYRWVLSRGMAVRGEMAIAYRMSGSLSDITERKEAEEQLKHNAFHDVLTDLPNRALFLDRLLHAMEVEKRREQYLFAVLFLDVDRFKVINDSLGHLVGDQLLIEVAQRLQNCLRPGDTIARLGGDEFAIILEDLVNVNDVTTVTERIHAALRLPFLLQTENKVQHEVITTVSIGIAMSSGGYEKPDDLLRDADTAMYRAKAQGPAHHALFDQAMHDHALHLLRLESDLRRAVESIYNNAPEFLLNYQPIVALESGTIAGFEALIRWRHPERGLVSPGEFIPLAEDTGLIVPISEWVFRASCAQLRQWQLQFGVELPLFMSINLSTKQLSEPNLVEDIRSTLQEFQIDPARIKLEITESAIMENAEAAIDVLKQLKGLGARLSIDDFGTGYSSLSYLQRFPVDTLKVDRSFVSQMENSEESAKLVWTIIALARNLHLDVTAEGVETEEQLEQLRMLTCEYGQGYFFSRPLDNEAAAALLLQKPQW